MRSAALLAGCLLLTATAQAGPPPSLDGLPLIELPAEGPGRHMAVIWSGDGGWRDLDKEIGEVLAQNGVSVVGVDSLRYFWSAKTPDAVAADLARLLVYLREREGRSAFLLVGYSFGAGILPFAVNRLPDDLRAAVVQVSLLGLEARAAFEIEVAG